MPNTEKRSPGDDTDRRPAGSADPSTRGERLAPGHHLYRGRDGVWRCRTAADRFIRLRTSSPLLAEVAAGLVDGEPVESILDRCGDTAGPLLDALRRQGIVTTAPTPPARPRPRSVHVTGTANPIGAAVAGLLRDEADVRTGAVDEPAVAAADVVVTCAGWLPDGLWSRIDRWCHTAAVPWHMSYLEGTCVYAGPFALPGSTAGYADTRGRRLAAAGSPDELLEHWAHLDETGGRGDVPWPAPGAVAVTAGLIVADVLAVLDGNAPPSAGHQLAIDPHSMLVRRHPVLPLPATAES